MDTIAKEAIEKAKKKVRVALVTLKLVSRWRETTFAAERFWSWPPIKPTARRKRRKADSAAIVEEL